MSEFDGWRESAIGRWFFEFYLQGYADASAAENGRAAGRIEVTRPEDHMTLVRNAGFINGVEYAIETDPFEDAREVKNEDTRNG